MRKTRNPGCIWEYYTISLFIFPQNYSYIPFCYENVHGPISALDESLWYCDVANTTKSELFLFIHSLPLAIPCKRIHHGHLQGKYGFLHEKKSIIYGPFLSDHCNCYILLLFSLLWLQCLLMHGLGVSKAHS